MYIVYISSYSIYTPHNNISIFLEKKSIVVTMATIKDVLIKVRILRATLSKNLKSNKGLST